MRACFLDHVFGELVDPLHEDLAADLALFHLVELGLPVARHGGGAECFNIHFFAELDQAQAFA